MRLLLCTQQVSGEWRLSVAERRFSEVNGKLSDCFSEVWTPNLRRYFSENAWRQHIGKSDESRAKTQFSPQRHRVPVANCDWHDVCATRKKIPPQVHQVHLPIGFMSLGHELVTFASSCKFIKFMLYRLASIAQTRNNIAKEILRLRCASLRISGCGLPLCSRPQGASSSSSSF